MDVCGAWDERSWWSMWDVYLLGTGRRELRSGWVDERIGFGLYQSCGNRGLVERVSVFWFQWCVWCRGEWVGIWIRDWRGGVVLCLSEVWVWIVCLDGRSRYLCIVLGGYLRIWGAHSVISCFTLWISVS